MVALIQQWVDSIGVFMASGMVAMLALTLGPLLARQLRWFGYDGQNKSDE